MPKKLISFGFRHGKPDGEDLEEGQLFTVIDIRQWFKKNPYHNRKLRQLRGTDKAVQDDILQTPGFNLSYAKLKDQITLVQLSDAVIYLGCTGGHHRSVYLTERLSKELNCPFEHRDYYKR